MSKTRQSLLTIATTGGLLAGAGAVGTAGAIPATAAPTTGAPTAGAPTAGAPTTGAPTTGAPTTGAPTTGARAPAYSISASATSAIPRVKPYTYVLYEQGKFAVATISARITGASGASGASAQVLARRFGAKSFRPIGTPAAVTSSPQVIHFEVTPSLATRYEVRVSTGTTVDVTSAEVTVYVALVQDIIGVPSKKCTATACSETIATVTQVPASAYKTEAAKPWYLYLGVSQSSGQQPTEAPKYLNLSGLSTASAARRISATEYKVTFTFRARADHPNVDFFPNACTKDAEAKDGLGLPGHHGCGNKRVRASDVYLG
jgi:ABC-type transport system substrate-binding protein